MLEHSLVLIDHFPQLSVFAATRTIRNISESEAFALYEANWRRVDVEQLTDREAALIRRLSEKYGKQGCYEMMVLR